MLKTQPALIQFAAFAIASSTQLHSEHFIGSWAGDSRASLPPATIAALWFDALQIQRGQSAASVQRAEYCGSALTNQNPPLKNMTATAQLDSTFRAYPSACIKRPVTRNSPPLSVLPCHTLVRSDDPVHWGSKPTLFSSFYLTINNPYVPNYFIKSYVKASLSTEMFSSSTTLHIMTRNANEMQICKLLVFNPTTRGKKYVFEWKCKQLIWLLLLHSLIKILM